MMLVNQKNYLVTREMQQQISYFIGFSHAVTRLAWAPCISPTCM